MFAHSMKEVLIVEDNPIVRRGLARVLKGAGFTVTTADNGLAALVELDEHSYQAIVCDIMMPVMDGIEFYERLETEDPEAAQLVLFVSAWAGEPEVGGFLRRTGRTVLQKPFEIDEFVRAVQEVTGERRKRDRRTGPERRSGQEPRRRGDRRGR